MSSSASSSRSSTPEHPKFEKLKRKRKEVIEPEVIADSSENSDSDESDNEAEGPEDTEEPVLSHAERRRKKKEEKLAEKLNAEGVPSTKKRKLKDGTSKAVDGPSDAMKRQNSIWVGNMSFKTQQDNLRTFFQSVGEITRINMPTKVPVGPGMKPENRGFAYVDFATAEAKTAAIALSEHPLLGRKLLIKDGDSFEGRPAAIAGENVITDPAVARKTHSKTAQKILRAQKQPAAPTLFFGNLGFETTDDSIRQLLEAHRQVGKKKEKEAGEAEDELKEEKSKSKDIWIRKIRMGTFEDSGLCKGFAFVDFTSIDHATSALINPKNHHLNGRNLVVEFASPDAVRRGAPKSSKPTDGAPPRGRRPLSAGYKKTRTAPSGKSKEESGVIKTITQDEPPLVDGDDTKRPDRKERSTFKSDRPDTRHKGPKSRPKPGAALALAKRESAAIIPSQGNKITF